MSLNNQNNDLPGQGWVLQRATVLPQELPRGRWWSQSSFLEMGPMEHTPMPGCPWLKGYKSFFFFLLNQNQKLFLFSGTKLFSKNLFLVNNKKGNTLPSNYTFFTLKPLTKQYMFTEDLLTIVQMNLPLQSFMSTMPKICSWAFSMGIGCPSLVCPPTKNA